MSHKFFVLVIFEVEAEKVGPWTAREAAIDYVKHRIDEGYLDQEHIRQWWIQSVETKLSK